MLLSLLRIELLRLAIWARGREESRILVHVRQQQRLAHGRPVVDAGAAVAVPAGSIHRDSTLYAVSPQKKLSRANS